MVSYNYLSENSRYFHNRFEIIVSILGEENAIRDLAHWHSEQHDNQRYTALLELLSRSDIKVSVFCAEVYYLFLCYYMTLYKRKMDEIPLIIDFVDAYVWAKKGHIYDLPLDQISVDGLERLNDDIIQTFISENKPFYLALTKRLEESKKELGLINERINKEDIDKLIQGFLYRKLIDDSENSKVNEMIITKNMSEYVDLLRVQKEGDPDWQVNYSFLNEATIEAVLESLSDMTSETLLRVYERGDEPVLIPEAVMEFISENVLQHVWMASNWSIIKFLSND